MPKAIPKMQLFYLSSSQISTCLLSISIRNQYLTISIRKKDGSSQRPSVKKNKIQYSVF